MEYLYQRTRAVQQTGVEPERVISAAGKHVIVLGGGDTGSDCVGTAHRQGARSVTSIELLPRPPEGRHPSEPWPVAMRMTYSVSSSHAEGGEREYALLTKSLAGRDGRVTGLRAVRVDFERDAQERPLLDKMREVPGSEFELPADLVLLAMGFLGPVRAGLLAGLGVELDPRGNVKADTRTFASSEPGVFAAGDARRGQSLVVWAQWEGREAARAVDAYLTGASRLPSRNAYV
jgi:glutamate synthase (NADPH/NADH) small chain